jgi:hypothetical protein
MGFYKDVTILAGENFVYNSACWSADCAEEAFKEWGKGQIACGPKQQSTRSWEPMHGMKINRRNLMQFSNQFHATTDLLVTKKLIPSFRVS